MKSFRKNSYNKSYHKVEQYDEATITELSKAYTQILKLIGEDLTREGLRKTPNRIAKTIQFLTHGYHLDPDAIARSAVFQEERSEMIIVKDIEIYSLCEHHLLPFFGKAHVAYIPNGKIIGLSKIGRIVDVYARRLQVQERLTCEIMECLDRVLQPLGVAVVIEARHLCMMMRGIQKQNSIATTSAFKGEFEKQATRNEFINLISANLAK